MGAPCELAEVGIWCWTQSISKVDSLQRNKKNLCFQIRQTQTTILIRTCHISVMTREKKKKLNGRDGEIPETRMSWAQIYGLGLHGSLVRINDKEEGPRLHPHHWIDQIS